MKDAYFIYKRVGLIILSILLAILMFPYNESEEIIDSNDSLDIFLYQVYKTFGEYGPFSFFVIVAIVIIIYQIVLIKKKKGSSYTNF